MRSLGIAWLLGLTGCHAIFELENRELGAPIPLMIGVCDNPSLTGDQRELYVSCNGAIYRTTRLDPTAAWGDLAVAYALDGSAVETTPEVAHDGRSMYVAHSFDGDAGNLDIVQRLRPDGIEWSNIEVIGSINDPTVRDVAGNRTDDDRMVVLASNRLGDVDLFVATRPAPDLGWSQADRIAGLSTEDDEGSPFISGDGLTLYFHRKVNPSGFDLFVARRSSREGPFGSAEPIRDLDDGHSEQDPWVSADGRDLYFFSDRPDPGPGIYYSRRE